MPPNSRTTTKIAATGEQSIDGQLVPDFAPKYNKIPQGNNVELCWNFAGKVNVTITVSPNSATFTEFSSSNFERNTCFTFNAMELGTYAISSNNLGTEDTPIYLSTQVEVVDYQDFGSELLIKMYGNSVPYADSTQVTSTVVGGMNVTDPSASVAPYTNACYVNAETNSTYVRDINNTPVITSFSQNSEIFTDSKIELTIGSADFVDYNCVEILVNHNIPCTFDPANQAADQIVCSVSLAQAEIHELAAMVDYSVDVFVNSAGKARPDFGVDLRFRFVPSLAGIAPLNYGSSYGGQELTLSGDALGASTQDIFIRCNEGDEHASQQIAVEIIDYNSVKFVTQDAKNQFVCQSPRLVYNSDVFNSVLEFVYIQSDDFTANLNRLQNFANNQVTIGASNLFLNGSDAQLSDLSKIKLQLRKQPQWVISYDRVPEHSDRKRRSVANSRVKRDHPAFDQEKWTYLDAVNGFVHLSASTMQINKADFYCKTLHNQAQLYDASGKDELDALFTWARAEWESDRSHYTVDYGAGFWLGIEQNYETNQYQSRYDPSIIFDNDRWCSAHPHNDKPLAYSNHGSTSCIVSSPVDSYRPVLCYLATDNEGVDVQTDCDVNSLTDDEVICTPQINIPLGSYVCDCNYEDFGQMTNTIIDISNQTYTINTPTTVSKFGGAVMEFTADSGTCTTCGTIVHLTNNETFAQWWGHATHTDDQNFSIELPALEGLFL